MPIPATTRLEDSLKQALRRLLEELGGLELAIEVPDEILIGRANEFSINKMFMASDANLDSSLPF